VQNSDEEAILWRFTPSHYSKTAPSRQGKIAFSLAKGAVFGKNPRHSHTAGISSATAHVEELLFGIMSKGSHLRLIGGLVKHIAEVILFYSLIA